MMAVICGTPTPVTTRVVQMLPGPMPTFTASTPRRTSSRAPSSVATLPATSCTSGKACAERVDRREHAFAVPVRRVDDEDVDAGATSAARASMRLGTGAHRRGDAEPAMLVLVRVGMLAPLEDVLDRDEPLEHALRVDHRQLLDPVLRQDPLRLVERRCRPAR